MSFARPSVAVLLPVFNEIHTIDACLDSLSVQDYEGSLVIMVAEGGSTDGTWDRLADYAGRIHLEVIDNPQRLQSYGLNLLAEKASAEVLVRADGHTTYSRDYVTRSVATLERTGATVVGGLMTPVGTATFTKAVAGAMSSPWAIGPSKFRHATVESEADAVYLGAIRRTDFLAVGGFRTFPTGVAEDADFFFRLRKSGARVVIDPEVRSEYRPRSEFSGLLRQFWRYGQGKAEMYWVNGQFPSWRPLAPMALLAGLLATAVLSLAVQSPLPLAIISGLWLGGLLMASLGHGLLGPLVALIAAAMQMAYGAGLAWGLFRGPGPLEALRSAPIGGVVSPVRLSTLAWSIPMALPLLAWWVGWFPGFGSSDTVDQLRQAATNAYTNHHPAIHTMLLDLSWSLFGSPGYVGLMQVVALTLLLVVTARRLVMLSVPIWAAIGAVSLVAILPAVGPTTSALWKDVPFALGLLWVFSEFLLLVSRNRDGWAGWGAPIRMGLALAVVWLFRHNGLLTALPLLMLIAFLVRKRVLVTLATLLLTLTAVTAVLYPIFDVGAASIEPSQVFVADVAAVVVNDPAVFSPDEVAFLETVAPLSIWVENYQCHDSTRLAFHPSFDTNPIGDEPSQFRRILLTAITDAPLTVLGHRACVSSFLFSPGLASQEYLHRPPFEFPPNDTGVTRQPLSDGALAVTRAIYVWSEEESRLWFTWSPALPVVASLIIYGGVAWRPTSRRLLIPGAVLFVHILNVVATSPAHEFRYAFPLYLVSLMSLPLVTFWFRSLPTMPDPPL